MLRDDWETRLENLDMEESGEILTSRQEKAEHEYIPKKKSKQAGILAIMDNHKNPAQS